MTLRPEPMVTILIPTHNRAALLPDAIQSALRQSHQNLEIVVLDNESSDDTTEVVRAYLNDPRLRYVRHVKDLGITGNWRYGITVARGEFFCLLHDDDTIEPDFVRKLVQPLLDDPTLALAFCDHHVMDPHRNLLPGDALSKRFRRDVLPAGPLKEGFARAVLVDYAVPVGASLFRRSMVSPEFIDPRAKGAIDYWLLYRILETGYGAYYLPEKLMSYRVHSGGMSSSATMYMSEGNLFRFEAAMSNPAFAPWYPQMAVRRRETLISYGIDLAQANRRAEARRALAEVLREGLDSRSLVTFLLACLGPLGSKIVNRLRAKSSRR